MGETVKPIKKKSVVDKWEKKFIWKERKTLSSILIAYNTTVLACFFFVSLILFNSTSSFLKNILFSNIVYKYIQSIITLNMLLDNRKWGAVYVCYTAYVKIIITCVLE